VRTLYTPFPSSDLKGGKKKEKALKLSDRPADEKEGEGEGKRRLSEEKKKGRRFPPWLSHPFQEEEKKKKAVGRVPRWRRKEGEGPLKREKKKEKAANLSICFSGAGEKEKEEKKKKPSISSSIFRQRMRGERKKKAPDLRERRGGEESQFNLSSRWKGGKKERPFILVVGERKKKNKRL